MSTVKSKGQTESWLIGILSQIFPNQILTPSDLKNPSKDFVLGFYLEFLNNLGINTDALTQAPPPMYEKFGDTYVLRKISVVLRNVFNKIMSDDIPPFGLMDLLQPSPGRTAAFFTAMTNFLCYAINKLTVIDDYIEELEAKKKNYDDLLMERESLRQKLNEEANSRARLSDLQVEVVQKQQELRSLSAEVDAADVVAVEKEKSVKELESKLELVTKDLADAQEEMARTEALVVRSPLSVKNQKLQLEQKLVETEEKVNSAKEALTSKKEISKKLDKLGEELGLRICLLEKIIVEAKEINREMEHGEEFRKKLLKGREDEEEKCEEKQKLCEKLAQLQESESGLLLRNETKNKEFQERIKVLRRELEEILKQKSAEKLLLQNAVEEYSDKVSRSEETYRALSRMYKEKNAALLLKEKSFLDELQNELKDANSWFQDPM